MMRTRVGLEFSERRDAPLCVGLFVLLSIFSTTGLAQQQDTMGETASPQESYPGDQLGDAKPDDEATAQTESEADAELSVESAVVLDEASEIIDTAEVEPNGSELDVSGLKTQLRKSRAIGFFTKLELRNQVNGLLDNFQTYHESDGRLTIDELKERFDLLLLKIMILLQDDDPELHQEIATARPGLWDILVDPEQFAMVQGS